MARLVSVIRSEQYLFERRQLPLQCDENLSLVMQMDDACMGCSKESLKRKELERFVSKFHALSSDELAVALMVTSKDILSLLQQLVPCVGCRRSVERLLKQLEKSGHPSLEPLVVTPTGSLSIRREYLFDPKAVFALFYIHGAKMVDIMESIPKSKKNKRCNLHSMDKHSNKTRTLNVWEDAWALLSQECREEVLLIDYDSLVKTLDDYLRKHRFCSECKSKVLRAYDILIGAIESKNEKGFVPALFDGLRCCGQERHIHVSAKNDFVSALIARAEPELTGSRRERHAKTLDIAQEEVLTCLGIHLYERLYRIQQTVRDEEQTWQILLFLGVDALRKSFDVALEEKQGRSNLELVCEEFVAEERLKEQKREQKREKKRRKKSNLRAQQQQQQEEQQLLEERARALKAAAIAAAAAAAKQQQQEKLISARVEKECYCDENTNDKRTQCNCCKARHAAAAATNKKQPVNKKKSKKGNDSTSLSNGSAGVGDGGGGGGDCAVFRARCNGCENDSGAITRKQHVTAAGDQCSSSSSQPQHVRHCSPVTSDHHSCADSPPPDGAATAAGNVTLLRGRAAVAEAADDGGQCRCASANSTPELQRQNKVGTINASRSVTSQSPTKSASSSSPFKRLSPSPGLKQQLSPVSCSNHSDIGYSSGHEGSENYSSTSSRDGSDVACQEGYCNHDGDNVLCDRADVIMPYKSCDDEQQRPLPESPKRRIALRNHCDNRSNTLSSAASADSSCFNSVGDLTWQLHEHCGGGGGGGGSGLALTLEEMLEDSGSSEDDCNECLISEEEIKHFRANQNVVREERDQLRQVLRQRFANMQTRLSYHVCPTLASHSSAGAPKRKNENEK